MEDDTATYVSHVGQPSLFGSKKQQFQFRFELINTDPVLKIIEYIERNMSMDNAHVRFLRSDSPLTSAASIHNV